MSRGCADGRSMHRRGSDGVAAPQVEADESPAPSCKWLKAEMSAASIACGRPVLSRGDVLIWLVGVSGTVVVAAGCVLGTTVLHW